MTTTTRQEFSCLKASKRISKGISGANGKVAHSGHIENVSLIRLAGWLHLAFSRLIINDIILHSFSPARSLPLSARAPETALSSAHMSDFRCGVTDVRVCQR